MEHRPDLENVLLNGLPDAERQHLLRLMDRVAVRKLKVLQTDGVRNNDPIALNDLYSAEPDDDRVRRERHA
jgi:hypothetical protein